MLSLSVLIIIPLRYCKIQTEYDKLKDERLQKWWPSKARDCPSAAAKTSSSPSFVGLRVLEQNGVMDIHAELEQLRRWRAGGDSYPRTHILVFSNWFFSFFWIREDDTYAVCLYGTTANGTMAQWRNGKKAKRQKGKKAKRQNRKQAKGQTGKMSNRQNGTMQMARCGDVDR